MLSKQIAVTLVSALASVLIAQDAMAESGTYESVVSLTTEYTKSERGDETVTGGSSIGTSTIIKSSGGPFVEGTSSLYGCIVFARKSTAGLDLEAPCTGTDNSGDKIFYLAKRKVGDVIPGGGGTGKSELQGGTGKYAGITGSCTYKIDAPSSNRVVSISKCQWQKP
jgi:hypothetical protein